MPAFMAIVEKPGIKYVDQKDGGFVLGCDPVAVITFQAEGGNPHDLADEVSKLRGKRVKVQVTPEQPELEMGGDDDGSADEPAEWVQT